MKSIGERIKQTRLARGWSQQELADKIGATRFLVCRYENETVLPSAKMLSKIASALNLDLSFLRGGETGSASAEIDFYGNFPSTDAKCRISPIIIPENSDYFCIQANKNYECGISEGDTVVLRPLQCSQSDFVGAVVCLPTELLIGSVWGENGSLWLIQNATQPPLDISDEKKYKIVGEVLYSIKDFESRKGRR